MKKVFFMFISISALTLAAQDKVVADNQRSDSVYQLKEGTITSDTDGNKFSIIGEVIYEKTFNKLKLTTDSNFGINASAQGLWKQWMVMAEVKTNYHNL